MRRGRNIEAVTAEMAITPEQAVEVNPANVINEFDHFLERPNTFSVEPLIKKLTVEAYPDHPEASSYFVDGFSSGRRIEDEISRFPVFPLSKMQDFDRILVDLVLDWSYPEPKYSFGPQSKLHDLIVRSDSQFAHNALVSHINIPFPRDRRHVFDGPDEMQYKSRLVGALFEAATYHGTPDLNPHAKHSLIEVYNSTRPGGFTHEWVMEQEAALSDDEKQYRRGGPDPSNLRDLQENMLARFMSYPHPDFDELVLETLQSEPVDDKRLLNVVTTLVRGRLRKRDDNFYADIADMIVAPYDEETAEIIKKYIGCAWDHGDEAEATQIEIQRTLARRLIDIETSRNIESENISSFRSSELLRFAVGLHPLRSVHLEMDAGKKSEWVKSPNYYEDMNYLLDLVKGPNIDGIKPLVAWHIAQSFEHDYSYDDKPQRAKAAYMAIADAVLSGNPGDYPMLMAESDIVSIMGAMGHILDGTSTAMDKMTDDDIFRLMTYREAYTDYVRSIYPEGAKPDRSKGSSMEEFNAFHNVDRLSNYFNQMARQFGERLEWREIQTNPKRYAEYMFAQVRNYAARFAYRVKDDGSWARSEDHRFNQEMVGQLQVAQDILELSEAGENIDDSLIRIVARTAEIHRQYMSTNLRYNNDFYHGHTSLTINLSRNLPLRLQGRALEMIRSGEIYDYMREDDKTKLQRRLAKAKII
ncbi:MAG: hypothetical protein U0451_01200 [Candidatus Saccharimonadales bacterium]